MRLVLFTAGKLGNSGSLLNRTSGSVSSVSSAEDSGGRGSIPLVTFPLVVVALEVTCSFFVGGEPTMSTSEATRDARVDASVFMDLILLAICSEI